MRCEPNCGFTASFGRGVSLGREAAIKGFPLLLSARLAWHVRAVRARARGLDLDAGLFTVEFYGRIRFCCKTARLTLVFPRETGFCESAQNSANPLG